MKIFILSAYPFDERVNKLAPHLKESAEIDPYQQHKIVSDANDADIIVFTEHHPDVDPYFFEVLKNKIYKIHKKKCFLYHDNDRSLTLMPTISPSIILSRFNPSFNQPFSYITQIERNKYIDQLRADSKKEYLFSFIGASRTHPIRKDIVSLTYDRSYLLDTSGKNSWELSEDEKESYYKSYAEVCLKSKFILCPRGIGPSSYRLYESLEMGIAPVIISDEWIPVPGPDWDKFSIRIRESEINRIPDILAQKERDAAEMGKLARQAWIDWFAKDKQFHELAEACVRIQSSKSKSNFFTYLSQYFQFFEPFHFKNLLRYYYRNKIKK